MRKTAGGIAMVVAAMIASSPVSAPADVTIGSSLAGNPMNNVCSTMIICTYFQTSGGSPTAVSPVSGTVVRWRLKAGSSGSPVALRILRPQGSSFTGAGTSATETITGGGAIDTFATSLPIGIGDVIGLNNDSSGILFSAPTGTISLPLLKYFDPEATGVQPLPDGATGLPNKQQMNLELQLNADIAPSSETTGPPTAPTSPTAPAISALRVTPAAFKAAKSGASVARKRRAKTGATIRYRLSADATVTFGVQKAQKGRKKGSRCVKARKGKGGKTGKRCTRYTQVNGAFNVVGKAGANSFKFTGRIADKELGKGKYRLSGTPSAGGETGASATAPFKIK